MAQIIIYYNKKQVSTGKPITVRVGKAAIHTNKLFLDGISGGVLFNAEKSYYVGKYGIACPLVIPIQEEPPSSKCLKERERYQKKKKERSY